MNREPTNREPIVSISVDARRMAAHNIIVTWSRSMQYLRGGMVQFRNLP
jgi:hypothetical protein